MIKRVIVKNYRVFRDFELALNKGLSVFVGDNEVGKSTLLEAINLVLTRKLNGRPIEQELTPHLFNQDSVKDYIASISSTTPQEPPSILIELYLEDQPGLEFIRGSMNSKRKDCQGLKLEIRFDDDFKEEYAALVAGKDKLKLVPSEYYTVHWYSFANNAVSARGLDIRPSYIDTTTIRLQSGTDYYLQDLIRTSLNAKERAGLHISFRGLKEQFSDQPAIKAINESLASKQGAITDKTLTISVDVSQRSNWETHLVPHLNELPFQQIGKGEQNALKVMLALERKAAESQVILIEEPENHLSYSAMNILISKIRDKCEGKQVLVTTHSAYVLNKLGLENLVLFSNDGSVSTTSLTQLSKETQDYFKKLSGYDTLRLVLAKKTILVEGPSDELIVQRTYLAKYGVLPIQDGTDVINVRGLSFLRFLEIAKLLNKAVVVVTDNDGDFKKNIEDKYALYSQCPNIKIFSSSDNLLPTLEPNLAACNDLAVLNKVLGGNHATIEDAKAFMVANKTECALRFFETAEAITFPKYLEDAVTK